MKIHVLGHASYVAVCRDGQILLIDPALRSSHQEGLLAFYPARTVLRRAISAPNCILLSHRHMDHFDAGSLAMLPRHVPVFCPRDGQMLGALSSLGFTNVTQLGDWQEANAAGVTVVATRSLAEAPECGFIIDDGRTRIWNQVDTVVSPAIVERINRNFGELDLALLRWQPLLDILPSNGGDVSFPYAAYAEILQTVSETRTRAMALGACGFRYRGAAAWINHLAFPQSRARAARDFRAMRRDRRTTVDVIDPGDIIDVTGKTARVRRNVSEFVRRRERWDDSQLMFCPWRPRWASMQRAPQSSAATLLRDVKRRLVAMLRHNTTLRELYRAWEVTYHLRVIGTAAADLFVDFSGKHIRFGSTPFPGASIQCFVKEAALRGVFRGDITWDRVVLGGDIFQWHRIYRLRRAQMELPVQLEIPNPLFMIIDDATAWNQYHAQRRV